ncbi:MAG: type II secretion system F family protein [Pirellulales bacterium]
MSKPNNVKGPSISLAHLIALNDEIRSLVRAGVPLETGLASLGKDMPGTLGRITTVLAERMSGGESLPEILASQSGAFPPVYRAVVEAGWRSGRLSVALEGLASSSRRLAELRRVVGMATFYPLLVFMLAYGLFIFFLVQILPKFQAASQSLRLPAQEPLAWLAKLGATVDYWGAAIPLVVLAMACLWWYRSGRAMVMHPRYAGTLLGWVPWMGRMFTCSRAATFAEVLALLVEHEVPLDEAVVLAAEAGGDTATQRAARAIAEGIRRGEGFDSHFGRSAEFPPLLRWLIVSGQRQGVLLPALRHAAEIYWQRAMQQVDLARVLLPTVLTLVIGGTVTLIYALALFVPWTTMLKHLS